MLAKTPILIGLTLFSGLSINVIVDYFYLRRGLVLIKKQGIGGISQNIFFWKQKEYGKRWRFRNFLIYLILLVIYFGLINYEIPGFDLWWGMILIIYFGVLMVVDIEYMLIPHVVSYFGLIIGIVVGAYLHGLHATIQGGVVGYLIMLFFYWLGNQYVNWTTKKKGGADEELVALGFGDVNLAGVIGLLLGWPGVIAGLFGGVLLGGIGGLIILIIMHLRGLHKPNYAIPYGPFLSAAAMLLLFLRGSF